MSGFVHRVNKLVSVQALNSRYQGEVLFLLNVQTRDNVVNLSDRGRRCMSYIGSDFFE